MAFYLKFIQKKKTKNKIRFPSSVEKPRSLIIIKEDTHTGGERFVDTLDSIRGEVMTEVMKSKKKVFQHRLSHQRHRFMAD
jgi:hypothetical protein